MRIPETEEILSALEKAPEYVQDFVSSSEFKEIIDSLYETHNIHLDDAERLSHVILASVLDLIPFGQIAQALDGALEKASPETKAALLTEINDRVFAELRLWALAEKELQEEEAREKENNGGEGKNSLHETVREAPVALSLKKEPAEPATQKPEYPHTDPYREPIE
jgi:hypothetical protein